MISIVRVAEEHGGVLTDGERAELAGFERVTFLAGDLTLDQRRGGVRGEVAQVFRVPQRERGDGAVLDALAHLVRRTETGQRHLALVVGGGQVTRRSGDADLVGEMMPLRFGCDCSSAAVLSNDVWSSSSP